MIQSVIFLTLGRSSTNKRSVRPGASAQTRSDDSAIMMGWLDFGPGAMRGNALELSLMPDSSVCACALAVVQGIVERPWTREKGSDSEKGARQISYRQRQGCWTSVVTNDAPSLHASRSPRCRAKGRKSRSVWSSGTSCSMHQAAIRQSIVLRTVRPSRRSAT